MFIKLFFLIYNSKLLFQQRRKFLIILMVQEFRRTKINKKIKKIKYLVFKLLTLSIIITYNYTITYLMFTNDIVL